MIPEGWKRIKLGMLTEKVGSGITPRGGSKSYLDSGIPLIRSQNVLTGQLSLDDVAYISENQHDIMKATQLQPLDVLLNITGASIGRSCIVPAVFKEGNVNQHVCIIRTNQDRLDPYYLSSFLNSNLGQKQVWMFQAGGNRQGLNFEQIRSFRMTIPSIEKQQKIAKILSTWDEAIRLMQELIAAKEQRKKGLMQRLLTGQVRFDGFGERPEKQGTRFGLFPSDWEMVHLEDVAKINAKSLSNKTKPDKTFHYIDLSTVDKGEVAFSNETITFAELPSRARRVLRNGDVIMATVRPNLLAYAVCDFDPKDVLCSTGFALISSKNKTDSQFVYQSLYGDLSQRQLHGLVTGSNYPAINSSEVARLIFAWPKHDEERHRIAAVLQACDREIHLLQQKLAALQQQKKGLMQRLLTGQVRVVPGKGQ